MRQARIDRALKTIPPLSPRFRKTTITASDRGILTLFKPGKNDPVNSSGKPDSFLLIQDEFKSTLSKIGAPGSSLASTFCSMYYNSECGVSDKTGTHDISAWVSILGGLPAEDEAEFSEYFGSETTNGLYSRFIYGVGPKTWRFNFRWEAKPEQRWPTQVYVGDLAHDMTQAWVEEARTIVHQRRREVRLICGLSFVDNAGRRRDCRKLRGAVEANHRACLAESGLGNFQVLVRHRQFFFQRIELWVVEDLPPLAAKRLIAWLSWFPPIRFLEGFRWRFLESRSHGDCWLNILRTDHAAAEQKDRRYSGEGEMPIHFEPPACNEPS
jgi:hypothetical protein